MNTQKSSASAECKNDVLKTVWAMEAEMSRHHRFFSRFCMYLCSGLGLIAAIIPTAFLRYPFDYLCALAGVVYFLWLFGWVQRNR